MKHKFIYTSKDCIQKHILCYFFSMRTNARRVLALLVCISSIIYVSINSWASEDLQYAQINMGIVGTPRYVYVDESSVGETSASATSASTTSDNPKTVYSIPDTNRSTAGQSGTITGDIQGQSSALADDTWGQSTVAQTNTDMNGDTSSADATLSSTSETTSDTLGDTTTSATSEPMINGVPASYWIQLMDDNLEYDEIDDLIHFFNPAINAAWETLETSIADLDYMIDSLETDERLFSDKKDTALESGDVMSYQLYTMQEMILGEAASSIQKSRDSLAKPKTRTNQQIRQGEISMSAGAKQLFIAYDSILDSENLLNELIALYEKSLNIASVSSSVGLATSTDVAKANAELLSAKANLSTLQASKSNIYQTLIVMCGWKASDTVQIGTILEFDTNQIDSFDPSVDITKAIGNNFTLIAFRTQEKDKSTTATRNRVNYENQLEAQLLIKLQSQYSDIISARSAFVSADTSFRVAQISATGAGIGYQYGSLSQIELLGAQIEFIQASMTYQTARRSLFQSIETYKQSIDGNCTIE